MNCGSIHGESLKTVELTVNGVADNRKLVVFGGGLDRQQVVGEL